MWIIQSDYNNKNAYFSTLEKELISLIDGEKNLIANLANISSWIFHSFPDLNWSGFYLWDENDQELILGPFQGRPACIRIKRERGVCGAAFRSQKTLNVDRIENFPGHIACDSASKSELVIPFTRGVFDLDSPTPFRFSKQDEDELSRIMNNIFKRLQIQ